MDAANNYKELVNIIINFHKLTVRIHKPKTKQKIKMLFMLITCTLNRVKWARKDKRVNIRCACYVISTKLIKKE